MALSNKYKIGGLVIGLLGFTSLLIAALNAQPSGLGSEVIVRQFPAVPVTLLVEKPTQPNSTTSGYSFQHNYQLVNVWASWCGVCRQEHAYLKQLQQQGIAIVGLNYRDQRLSALNYLEQLGNPYLNVIFDPEGKLALDLGVIGTPETYLVTKSGKILYKHSGLFDDRVWQKHFAHYFR